MKFFIGALALVAATSALADSLYTPLAGPGQVGAYGADSLYTPIATPTYGTSTRIITGHDGQRSVEVAPAFGPDSEVRVIDYSGGHVTEDVIDQYGVRELE